MTYHPTFHQLVQLSSHPPTLALVKVGAEVVATNVEWHMNVEPVVFNTPNVMLSTSNAILKLQEVLLQPRPLMGGCHSPLNGFELNPALLSLPRGAPDSWYAPLIQLSINDGKVWQCSPNIVQ